MSEILNRKIQPPSRGIQEIDFFYPEKYTLSNGIPVYLINTGSQELSRIELIFKAGSWNQRKPFVASSANQMLTEGSAQFSAGDIAEMLDFHGAYLDTTPGRDFASLSLYALNKQMDNVLPLFEDVVKNPSFPDNELRIFLDKQSQQLKVNRQKPGFLARTYFSELIFGKNHPYGKVLLQEDIDSIQRKDLIYHHRYNYLQGYCALIVAGKLNDRTIRLVEKHFGSSDWFEQKDDGLHAKPEDPYGQLNGNSVFIEKTTLVQSAIRIGRKLFTQKHEDFAPMQVLNTVLGGYFGSRLMSNIREDKGYSYGIGSGVMSYQNAGYFFISTEVASESCDDALKEIFKETERLIQEEIPEKELNLVKNYMMGSFMRSMDGAFAIAENFRKLLMFGFDEKYNREYLEKIKWVRPDELKRIAEKYLSKRNLKELVVGNQLQLSTVKL